MRPRPGPGTTIAAESFSLPAGPQDVAAGRANFVAVTGVIDELEWLHLAASGHRRALFRWDGLDCTATWLAP